MPTPRQWRTRRCSTKPREARWVSSVSLEKNCKSLPRRRRASRRGGWRGSRSFLAEKNNAFNDKTQEALYVSTMERDFDNVSVDSLEFAGVGANSILRG